MANQTDAVSVDREQLAAALRELATGLRSTLASDAGDDDRRMFRLSGAVERSGRKAGWLLWQANKAGLLDHLPGIGVIFEAATGEYCPDGLPGEPDSEGFYPDGGMVHGGGWRGPLAGCFGIFRAFTERWLPAHDVTFPPPDAGYTGTPGAVEAWQIDSGRDDARAMERAAALLERVQDEDAGEGKREAAPGGDGPTPTDERQANIWRSEGMTPTVIKTVMGEHMSLDTVRAAAKSLELRGPGRGQRDFRYPINAAIQIMNRLAHHGGRGGAAGKDQRERQAALQRWCAKYGFELREGKAAIKATKSKR